MPHDERDDEESFSPTFRERVRNLEIKYRFISDDYIKTEEKHAAVHKDYEERIRELKTFKDNMTGRLIAFGSVSAIVTAVVVAVVTRLLK